MNEHVMKKLLRWRQAVELTGISLRTLKRYASAGAFLVFRTTPRLTLISEESLLAWAKRNPCGPSED